MKLARDIDGEREKKREREREGKTKEQLLQEKERLISRELY